ncbi:PREDICTED: von Willebrand factor D and EGF domain-containing protein-like, partial [Acropora digitifera]|uniref:von Willebrand factor D and EGF domain-containing protein-like n=1 Tax=Acropora digitifera TaxID=70779 RepID=UPI000779F4B0
MIIAINFTEQLVHSYRFSSIKISEKLELLELLSFSRALKYDELKKNTCSINRYCFVPNEPNPSNWCQQCIPEMSRNTWTKRQVNHPPNVTLESNYYVVYRENFKLPVEAVDPEGMPVTVSLLRGSPQKAMIQNNVLYWNVTTNQTTQFFFKATDACQASSTFNMTLTVVPCPCNNSGQCVPQEPRGQRNYSCQCPPGYTGQYCGTEIDECKSYPCLRGRCTDLLNNYSCSCYPGFEGRNCDVDKDICKSSPCVNDIDDCVNHTCTNGASCIDGINVYSCNCTAGFTGAYCETDIDECVSHTCANGASCVDGINAYSCKCAKGFSGASCDIDIDDCVNHTCANGASCVDGINNYSCNCSVGFTGSSCETDINDCVNHTCENGAACLDGINSYWCNCSAGFTGSNCETDINDCVNHTCENGAACLDGINSYWCNCSAGFTGSNCETDIDDCVNHTCANGASCVDGINNYSCNCLVGFTGWNCETAVPQKFPSLYLGYPKISVKDEPENEIVSLLCIVPIHEKVRQWRNVTYEIEWYTDGKRSKFTEKPFCKPQNGRNENSRPCPGDKEIRSLLNGTGSLNYYEPGQRITCKVKAKFTNNPRHPWSDTVTIQRPFFAGINVSPTTLLISECKDPFFHEITLTPTIPVRKNSFGTFLSVTFYLPKGLWLVNKEKCSVQLEGTNSVTVKVGATCTTLYGLKKLSVITPKIANHFQSKFWGVFGLPTIWVTVLQKEQPLHKCMSITDPHILVLHKVTGPQRWHDFFGREEYLLYRNQERNFEVQTKQWGCNGQGITCNCGVVIRDHNDLISFSCCGNPPKAYRDDFTPISVDIPRLKCLAPGITITQLIKGFNSKYEVIVPTGVKVTVERNYWGIDVTIYTPRAKHSQNESGLCTYSGNDGDITHLAGKHRLTASTSYFQTLPAEVNKDARPFEKSCACDETQDKALTTECTIDGIPVITSFIADTTGTYNRIKMCDNNPEKTQKYKKIRAIEGADDLTREDLKMLMEPLKSNKSLWEETPVVSKDNATRYCAERLLETKVGKLCAKLGINVQALVNVCSADIEYTGDFSFVIGVVSVLINECQDVIIENMTVNTNQTNNATKPTMPPALEEVFRLLCPNDCTFNGKCVNRSCVCNKDYTADDCSISMYQKPTITRIQSNGLCDRRKRPCEKTTVLGRDFLNSTNMTCHIREIEIVNSSWIPNKSETKYQGKMTDLFLVECLLPFLPVLRMRYNKTIEGTPAAGLMISVSNNGVDKSSQELKMISFDSVCMDCNVSTGCTLKKNTCFINRYCFVPNEPNPSNWCQQCMPEMSRNTWTKRRVNHPPNVILESNYYVVYRENFKLLIEAVDPEGMPVTVSLMGGSPKKAMIRNNVLYWNVTTNRTTQFFFKATDACQASSTFNLTLTVVPCPCNNSGQCIPQEPRGQRNYRCQCPPGYTGQYCGNEMDECKSYPCLRGRCTDLLNNYSCSCYPGFEGRNCDVDKDICKSSPCVNGDGQPCPYGQTGTSLSTCS